MAANKFATMLHGNTNKMTLILIYAILEWILIILLLLNSLFSYLLVKFADYFGLKRPCLWCCRLDHIFEPGKVHNSYRDLVCEAHATEISNLNYCTKHQKLGELRDLCEDCSSSSRTENSQFSEFAFLSRMNQIGMNQEEEEEKVVEDGKENLVCSCCGGNLKHQFYSPRILFKQSLESFDYIQKRKFLIELRDTPQTDGDDHSDGSRSEFVEDRQENDCREDKKESQMATEFDRVSERREDIKVRMAENIGEKLNYSASEIVSKHLDFFIDRDDCRLIPVELIDFSSDEIPNEEKEQKEEQGSFDNLDVILDFDVNLRTRTESVVENWSSSGVTVEILESVSSAVDGNSSAFCAEGDSLKEEEEEEEGRVAITEATQTPSSDNDKEVEETAATSRVSDSDLHQDIHMWYDELEAEISIGTEIPDQVPVDDVGTKDILSLSPRIQEDPSTNSEFNHDTIHDSRQEDDGMVEFKTLSIEMRAQETTHHIDSSLELNIENDEEKVPDTPNSVENLHQLHKKLQLLDRKESGTEESSLDGSYDVSEIEGCESLEKLKSALRAERKALNALYAELEEERSASAVAANQTMAMINRLQEEKAAMQMEALQYQRMMEEQSEYDQEALQILNDLIFKREKENQELEKELEIYRKTVLEYENREKMLMFRSKNNGSPRSRNYSVSCSNSEDIDLNNEESSNQHTPADEEDDDAVVYLEESLANFEEERQSILEQLKLLEHKLFTLSDEEEEHFEDIKSIEHYYQHNGNGHGNGNGNGIENGNGHSKEMNGNYHQEKRAIGLKAKRLLPLFDATVDPDGEEDDVENGDELEYRKLAIEQEVEVVYERLQALEADREFLRHCIGSLRKGDRGLELLHEILQHLRDLKRVDLSVKSIGDGVLS